MTPPAIQAARAVFSGTGPYRRVWSTTGFSWMRATIYLPSKANNEIVYGSPHDAAYVYAGGWGESAQAVDAGMEHETGTDQWCAFIKCKHFHYDKRFLAGQEVILTLSVTADDSLLLTVTGNGLDGQAQTATVSLSGGDEDPLIGWPASGSGVVLKRMTSIAQNPQNLRSGSRISGVKWSNVQIGTSAADATAWMAQQTDGHMNFPDTSAISVEFTDNSNEVDSIALT